MINTPSNWEQVTQALDKAGVEPLKARLRGFKAAAKLVDKAIHKAGEARSPRTPPRGQRLSNAYRAGYYEGLLFAHCMNALGEFPEANKDAILEAETHD